MVNDDALAESNALRCAARLPRSRLADAPSPPRALTPSTMVEALVRFGKGQIGSGLGLAAAVEEDEVKACGGDDGPVDAPGLACQVEPYERQLRRGEVVGLEEEAVVPPRVGLAVGGGVAADEESVDRGGQRVQEAPR